MGSCFYSLMMLIKIEVQSVVQNIKNNGQKKAQDLVLAPFGFYITSILSALAAKIYLE